MLKIDLKDAFNLASRVGMRAQLRRSGFNELARMADFILGKGCDLRVEDLNISMRTGTPQGNTLSVVFFCLLLQPVLRAVQQEVGQVQVRSIIDDIHIIGQPTDVFRAFDTLVVKAEEVGLLVNAEKSCLLIPRLSAQSIIEHAEDRGLRGSPFGHQYEQLVGEHCAQVIASHDGLFVALRDSQMPAQASTLELPQSGSGAQPHRQVV